MIVTILTIWTFIGILGVGAIFAHREDRCQTSPKQFLILCLCGGPLWWIVAVFYFLNLFVDKIT